MPKGPNGRKGRQRNPFARRAAGPAPKGNFKFCETCGYMTTMYGNRGEAESVYGEDAKLHVGSKGVHREGEMVVSGRVYY